MLHQVRTKRNAKINYTIYAALFIYLADTYTHTRAAKKNADANAPTRFGGYAAVSVAYSHVMVAAPMISPEPT
jgi:hypothetical protein